MRIVKPSEAQVSKVQENKRRMKKCMKEDTYQPFWKKTVSSHQQENHIMNGLSHSKTHQSMSLPLMKEKVLALAQIMLFDSNFDFFK